MYHSGDGISFRSGLSSPLLHLCSESYPPNDFRVLSSITTPVKPFIIILDGMGLSFTIFLVHGTVRVLSLLTIRRESILQEFTPFKP